MSGARPCLSFHDPRIPAAEQRFWKRWPGSLPASGSELMNVATGAQGKVIQAIRPFLLLQFPAGAAGPVVLHAADHADLPHPVPGPGRPVGSEAVLAVERLRARAGIGDPQRRRLRGVDDGLQAQPGQADRVGQNEAAIARLVYRHADLRMLTKAGSRRTRRFRVRGSAVHRGSAGWRLPRRRRLASRTPVRSPRHGSSGPPPP